MDKPSKPLKRLFTPATKLSMAQRYEARERSAALAREFGIRPTLVHQWVDDYRQGGSAGLIRLVLTFRALAATIWDGFPVLAAGSTCT
jgi:transposase-like protein